MNPKVTLEQWQVLIAVVEEGSYAAAAEKLHRTQSTLTYAIQTLQDRLGIELFRKEGRRSQLTSGGQQIYRRGKALVAEAERLEHMASRMAAGCEAEIRLAVDALYPTWMLLECLAEFSNDFPHTRVELYETILGGAEELMSLRRVDLAVTAILPEGVIGEPLMQVRFIPVAAPQHPLHQLGRELLLEELRGHRQVVMRDSASRREYSAGWLRAEQRWTVSHKATSIRALCMGLGFAWLPEPIIRDELDRGELKVLPVQDQPTRHAILQLAVTDRDLPGPGIRHLCQLLRDASTRHGHGPTSEDPVVEMDSEPLQLERAAEPAAGPNGRVRLP